MKFEKKYTKPNTNIMEKNKARIISNSKKVNNIINQLTPKNQIDILENSKEEKAVYIIISRNECPACDRVVKKLGLELNEELVKDINFYTIIRDKVNCPSIKFVGTPTTLFVLNGELKDMIIGNSNKLKEKLNEFMNLG